MKLLKLLKLREYCPCPLFDRKVVVFSCNLCRKLEVNISIDIIIFICNCIYVCVYVCIYIGIDGIDGTSYTSYTSCPLLIVDACLTRIKNVRSQNVRIQNLIGGLCCVGFIVCFCTYIKKEHKGNIAQCDFDLRDGVWYRSTESVDGVLIKS